MFRPRARGPAKAATAVGAVALVGAIGLAVVLARRPAVVRAAVARWREMNTPNAGRQGGLPPDVLQVVAVLEAAGWRHYQFSPRLEDEVKIAPFIVEAGWPIECHLADDNVVGYLDELRQTPSCRVLGLSGELAIARCSH
jgi:hypothetical protein